MRWRIDSFGGINPAKHPEKLTASLAVRCVNTHLDYGVINGMELPIPFNTAQAGTRRVRSDHEGNIITGDTHEFELTQQTARDSKLIYKSTGEVIGEKGVVAAIMPAPDAMALDYIAGDITERQHTGGFQELGNLWTKMEERTRDATYQGIDIIHTDDGTVDSQQTLMPDNLKKNIEQPDYDDPADQGDSDKANYYSFDQYTHAELYPNFIPCAYVVTWIDIYGRESRPSKPVVDFNPESSGKRHVLTFPGVTDGSVVSVRVYRAVSNAHSRDNPTAGQSAFLPIAEMPATTQAWTVDVPLDIQGVLTLESQTYDDAPNRLNFLCETESGMLVCADDDMESVRLSMRHVWHSWPKRRRINLPKGSKVRDIQVKGEVIYILTANGNYVAQVAQDSGMGGVRVHVQRVEAPAPIIKGIRACITDYGCVYCSDQGIIAINGSSARMLTERLIPANTWRYRESRPVAIEYYRGRLFLFREDDCAIINLPDPTFGSTVDAVMTTATVKARDAHVTRDGRFIILQRDYTLAEWRPANIDDSTEWTYESLHAHMSDRVQVTAARISGSFKGNAQIFTDDLFLDDFDKTEDAPRIFRLKRGWASHQLHFILKGRKECHSITIGSTVAAVSMNTAGS